ncbi:invasion associated locus B family protein [Brucella intermedia LMG 3301]|uniref:Invasion associated locus B family protein n=3 Tax=Brucella intermedia TaxID=94625 RepID=C4WIJ6_9HYPH|nr:invasion associated locus B family protein [Brucella intermedia LMG 3301]SUB11962.1 Invasion protein B, involved in pathogenesis [Brucella intermedia]
MLNIIFLNTVSEYTAPGAIHFRENLFMKIYRVIGLAFTLATISGASSFAAPLPGGASNLQETYEDWTVSCQNQKDTSICVMRQEQSSTQTGQRVLTAELRNVAGKVEGVLLMPFGLDLAKGAALKIDDAAAPNLAFSTCLPQGCLAPVSFDAKQVAALKAGTNINVTTTALSPSQPVAFKVSLKGFGAALDRIIALTK